MLWYVRFDWPIAFHREMSRPRHRIASASFSVRAVSASRRNAEGRPSSEIAVAAASSGSTARYACVSEGFASRNRSTLVLSVRSNPLIRPIDVHSCWNAALRASLVDLDCLPSAPPT